MSIQITSHTHEYNGYHPSCEDLQQTSVLSSGTHCVLSWLYETGDKHRQDGPLDILCSSAHTLMDPIDVNHIQVTFKSEPPLGRSMHLAYHIAIESIYSFLIRHDIKVSLPITLPIEMWWSLSKHQRMKGCTTSSPPSGHIHKLVQKRKLTK